MKRLIILCLAIIQSISFWGQTPETNISIGLVMPSSTDCDYLTEGQIARLTTKIERICTQNGVSSGYYPEGFVLYPVFEIYNEEIVEGGIQKIYSLSFEMSLSVRQLGSAVAHTVSKTYKGAGNSKEKAIMNALSSINPDDPLFKQFISTAKTRIADYYRLNTDRLMAKAQNLSQQQQYEEALALLMSIPSEVEQYPAVLDMATRIYTDYIDRQSKEQIAVAKGLIANRNYTEAITILGAINPNSSQYDIALELIKSIDDRLTEEEKKEWEFKLQQYQDAVSLEKQRIESKDAYNTQMFDAIKSVAQTYCQNRPPVTYYLVR